MKVTHKKNVQLRKMVAAMKRQKIAELGVSEEEFKGIQKLRYGTPKKFHTTPLQFKRGLADGTIKILKLKGGVYQ